MVATRGPGFALDETLCPDGSSHPSEGRIALLPQPVGPNHKQLVVIYQIKTKQGKEGQLIVERYLVDQGKTEVSAGRAWLLPSVSLGLGRPRHDCDHLSHCVPLRCRKGRSTAEPLDVDTVRHLEHMWHVMADQDNW